MKRARSWPALLSLALALTLNWIQVSHCRMAPLGLKPYRPNKSYMDSPDSHIDSFMKNHHLGYPQPSNSLYHHIKEDVDYYDLKDLPPSLQMFDYRDPPQPLHRFPLNDDQASPHLKPLQQSHVAPHSVHVEQHIKATSRPVVKESPKLKVEARSGIGQAGSKQMAALVPAGHQESVMEREDSMRPSEASSIADVYLLAVIAGCAVAAVSGLALTGLCWYRMHKRVKATSDVEYPAYGVTGPAKEKGGPPGDRKLAQSAQMYHYQHQKQQMIASERLEGGGNGSEGESEEECEEGDYTVFECPGLATAGEMEVRNPLFNDHTPVATPAEK